MTFSAGKAAGLRKLYRFNFGGFTRSNERGMVRVNAKNAEVSDEYPRDTAILLKTP